MAAAYATRLLMTRIGGLLQPALAAAAFASALAATAATAGPHRPRDQDRAYEGVRMGALPLRDIQAQWRQGMPGYDYLGSDYDPQSGNYRLKFMRDGAVDWVDVDGRTGRELGRSRR